MWSSIICRTHDSQSFLPTLHSHRLSSHRSHLQVRKEKDRTNPSCVPEERDILPTHTHAKTSNSDQTWSQLPQRCRQRQRFDETQTRRRYMMGWGEWSEPGVGGAGGRQGCWLSGRCRLEEKELEREIQAHFWFVSGRHSQKTFQAAIKCVTIQKAPPPSQRLRYTLLLPPSEITWTQPVRCL